MILCDVEIQAALRNGTLIIEPQPTAEDFSTSAVDLHLGNEFKRWKQPAAGMEIVIDPGSDRFNFKTLAQNYLEEIPKDANDSVILQPDSLILGITQEYIDLPIESRYAARVEGRSSLARLGLAIHITAPTIHSGFRGQITLEIINFGVLPVRLRPGLSVCQLIVEQVFGTPGRQMEGMFQDQTSVEGQ